MQKKHTLLFGAHVSISGGLEKAFQRGKSIGCTAIQIFTKSNRQWAAKPLTKNDIELFKQAHKSSPIKHVIVHASYLINIGSPNTDTHKKSVAALEKELKRCEQLGIRHLVLHPGSHLKTGEDECLKKVASSLDSIFEKIPGNTMILLETMAGQGSSLCYVFEHIKKIMRYSSHKKRLGVCFDTCHAFAAGYDFRTPKTYEAMWKKFDKTIGLNKIKAMHINDSKKELGSRVDRHEDIGKGKIGTKAFSLLFNDERFFDVPKILETPAKTELDYVANMKTIKKLISPTTRKKLGLKK